MKIVLEILKVVYEWAKKAGQVTIVAIVVDGSAVVIGGGYYLYSNLDQISAATDKMHSSAQKIESMSSDFSSMKADLADIKSNSYTIDRKLNDIDKTLVKQNSKLNVIVDNTDNPDRIYRLFYELDRKVDSIYDWKQHVMNQREKIESKTFKIEMRNGEKDQ